MDPASPPPVPARTHVQELSELDPKDGGPTPADLAELRKTVVNHEEAEADWWTKGADAEDKHSMADRYAPHAAPPPRLIVTVYAPSCELYPSTTST